MAARPVILIAIAVIAIFFVVWGVRQVGQTEKIADEARLRAFTASLENSMNVKSNRLGDVEERVFSLPEDVESICFVDNQKEIDEFANNELRSQLKQFPRFNIFLFPSEKFNPVRLNIQLKQNPLCLEPSNSKIKLILENKGSFAEINTEATQDKDCVSVVYNGNPDEKIDMVFLPYGYDDLKDFSKDVDSYINKQFNVVEPFKSNINKINFFRIDKQENLGCEIGDLIRCDDFRVKLLASECPNDYVFVLADRNRFLDLAKPVRSSTIANTIKVNTADNPLLIMHELGHAIGDLADEYVDEKYYQGLDFKPDSYPNCDVVSCSKWQNIDNVGCYRGCSLKGFYRPTDNSLMKSLKTDSYGPVNLAEISERLYRYK